MSQDRFEENWQEFKGQLKGKWDKLTDQDLAKMDGKYEQFLNAMQKRYGYSREETEHEFSNWDWSKVESPLWGGDEIRNRLERVEDKTWRENDRFHEGKVGEKPKSSERSWKQQKFRQQRSKIKTASKKEIAIKREKQVRGSSTKL